MLAKLSLSAGLLSLSVLAGPAEPKIRIAVNMTTIESFPILAAAESLPGRIEVLKSPNGRDAMTQLVSGQADAATGSETQALLNSVNEPRIRIVLTLAECRYRIVARRSSGIRRLSDLRGRKVAATANTSSQYYLSRMLSRAGLNDSDIQLVSLEGQEMPMALEKHNVDAVSIWEPHAENSLRALGKDAIAFVDAAAYTERFNLNTRTDVLTAPEKRSALITAIREIAGASTRLRKRRAQMIPMLAPKVGVPESTLFAVWRQFTFPASLSGELRAALREVEPWAAATQNRRPRSDQDLNALIDFNVYQEEKSSKPSPN